MLSRAGLLVMSTVDAVMVGRFSTQELGFQGIAAAPFIAIMVTTFGLMSGALVMTAYEFGAGNSRQCGTVWRRTLLLALGFGLVGTLISLAGEPFLLLVGQTPDLARGGGQVLAILGFGLPPLLIFVASGFLLEGTRRPLPPVAIMILANILNFTLNWLLIGGNMGLPAMGAAGAAWATSGSRLFGAVAIVIYLWVMDERYQLGVRSKAIGRWHDWSQQRRIGYASGASTWIESSAFAALSLFAGLLGTVPLAAYTIAFNILSLFFMIGLGFATSTAVLVSNARGRGDLAAMHRAGWTGLGLNSMIMVVMGALIISMPGTFAGFYATDKSLIEVAAPLIGFIGLILISDSGQVVMANALRGRGEIWSPSAAHFISFFGVMVPLGWVLSRLLGLGPMGLFQATLAGTIVALVLLAWRFHWLAVRDP